jgi:hypothetical protein
LQDAKGNDQVDQMLTIILPMNRELKVPWEVARDWNVRWSC